MDFPMFKKTKNLKWFLHISFHKLKYKNGDCWAWGKDIGNICIKGIYCVCIVFDLYDTKKEYSL